MDVLKYYMLDELVNKINRIYSNMWIEWTQLFAIGYVSHRLTHQYFGDPLYHFSGLVCGAVLSAVDHISTIPYVRLINQPSIVEDEKFKKLLEKKNLVERSVILGKTPTWSQYKKRSIIIDGFILVSSFLYPPVGYAYLSYSPIIFLSSREGCGKISALIEEYVSANEENSLSKLV